jgi:hypothetical protein
MFEDALRDDRADTDERPVLLARPSAMHRPHRKPVHPPPRSAQGVAASPRGAARPRRAQPTPRAGRPRRRHRSQGTEVGRSRRPGSGTTRGTAPSAVNAHPPRPAEAPRTLSSMSAACAASGPRNIRSRPRSRVRPASAPRARSTSAAVLSAARRRGRSAALTCGARCAFHTSASTKAKDASESADARASGGASSGCVASL